MINTRRQMTLPRLTLKDEPWTFFNYNKENSFYYEYNAMALRNDMNIFETTVFNFCNLVFVTKLIKICENLYSY